MTWKFDFKQLKFITDLLSIFGQFSVLIVTRNSAISYTFKVEYWDQDRDRLRSYWAENPGPRFSILRDHWEP